MGNKHARSPLQLMRSRYSAFVLEKFEYLLATHHPDYLNGLSIDALRAGPYPDWLGLEIVDNNSASVTFKAWYMEEGKLDAIFECSDFINKDGHWYYSQGEQFTCKPPKRNQNCICQSGKKFKHCCMLKSV